jgi:hypothetical protein
MNLNQDNPLPATAYMSGEEREQFAQSLEIGWRDYLGVDRYEAFRKRVNPPAWLTELPQLPELDEEGRLPA